MQIIVFHLEEWLELAIFLISFEFGAFQHLWAPFPGGVK